MIRSDPGFLFHRPEFIFRNTESNIVSFFEDSATIYFSRIGNALISLDRAPFGSFILNKDADKSEITSLVTKISTWSMENRITHLIIRSFPEVYHPPQNTLIKEALMDAGFSVQYQDITQILYISHGAMNLNTHKKRRLRNAEAAGFVFQQLTAERLDESYALVVESRQNKNYPVTITLKDLKDMFRLFPESYLLFGVFYKNKLIAASVAIRVNKEILYSFYIGDDLDYRMYSPVTYLIHEMYGYCIRNDLKILDLGMSTDKGILNSGLYTFKKTFGSIDSYKLTFLKQL